jgi:hypothetical protein
MLWVPSVLVIVAEREPTSCFFEPKRVKQIAFEMGDATAF